jgi:hypothetical protein
MKSKLVGFRARPIINERTQSTDDWKKNSQARPAETIRVEATLAKLNLAESAGAIYMQPFKTKLIRPLR